MADTPISARAQLHHHLFCLVHRDINAPSKKSWVNNNAATHTNMAASVDTQIATQAAKKLLSIRVSNFMAVLHPISE
jgi:hypothetical protein